MESPLTKKKALVIVAHPDDETIWMGGMILGSKDIDWTIFSLCRGNDPIRAPRFKKACEYYNARGLMSDLEDEGILNIEKSLPEIKKRIIDNFANEKFEYIFTHNYNGEYGHERHSAVHLAIKELVKEKKIITCEKLFFFAYQYQLDQNAIYNSPASNFVVELDNQTSTNKKGVIEKIYGFNKDTFENKMCLSKETFILSDV
jgi:LmbE family N-acetylglucosaminyl deacetylase